MINFHRLSPDQMDQYNHIRFACPERGCEYTFANLFLWGQQKVAFLHGCILFFTHFYGRSVYPYPIGPGNKKAAIEAILQDARERGIPCRISSITAADKEELETLFPDRFHIRPNRDSFDYVYDINALADLRGRKYQNKRNHFNRFCTDHPDHRVVPITCDMMPQVKEFVGGWFSRRLESNPQGDYLMENLAMARTFNHCGEIGMEGIALMDGDEILAITMGSQMSDNTFDIHFEKALESVSGVYAAINCHFARYLREKYPHLQYLNREDDMGLEGLRCAKVSYHPHHMVEKYWAYSVEDYHED